MRGVKGKVVKKRFVRIFGRVLLQTFNRMLGGVSRLVIIGTSIFLFDRFEKTGATTRRIRKIKSMIRWISIDMPFT